MYIVSAHLDGLGGGGAANDDASGCALVLEIARILASSDIVTDVSIRLVFWNNEETGLQGSRSYVERRKSLQGQQVEGRYPEPVWLGIIQHDQILFDHGLPVQNEQIPGADMDIEYDGSSAQAGKSKQLAEMLKSGNTQYATHYPAEIGNEMCCTDSVPFKDVVPAVSIRENKRIDEIGKGSQPNWHQPTDVYATYSEKDFLFGLNICQTTLGTISQLTGLKANPVKSCLLKGKQQCSCTDNDCWNRFASDQCLRPSIQDQTRFLNRVLKRKVLYCTRKFG
jgi:hypothetical protein